MSDPSTAMPVVASSSRRILIALGIGTAMLLAWLLRGVLVPLFLAFLLAYALDPFVDRLEDLRVPRTAAAVLVMGGLCTVGTLVLVFAIPYLIDEFRVASEQLPQQLEALVERADPWVGQFLHVKLPHTWSELAAKIAVELESGLPSLLEGATVALFGTFNVILVIVGTLIIPVFSLYLLIDFDRNVDRAKNLVPRRWGPLVASISAEIHRTLGGYVRGQLTACLLLATLYAAGLNLVGLRLAIPIGVITGTFAFVPYVGFGIGVAMAAAMALVDWHGNNHVLSVIAVMLAVQTLDGMMITPRIVGRSVGLRPIEVLLTMMTAATLFGFLGVLLAVPLGAVVKILVGRATNVYLASRFYGEPAPAPPFVQPAPLAAVTPFYSSTADDAKR